MPQNLFKLSKIMMSLALAGLFGVITIFGGLGQPAPVVFAAGETCFVSLNNSSATDYQSADAAAVQQAINAASPGDVIKIAGTCGGVTPTAGISQTAYIAQNLTLRGGYTTTNWSVSDPDTYPTTLSANNLGRVVVITGTASAQVDSLIVRAGAANAGAGLYVDTAAGLTLLNSQVMSNTANALALGDGGGGLGNLGTTIVSGTTFSYNQSDLAGAVGNGPTGKLTINGSTFNDNLAGTAGALGNTGWVTVTASSFISNATSSGAGAIGNAQRDGGPGWMRLENSTVLSNTSSGGGGAIDNDGGELYLITTRFEANKGRQGGAIYNNDGTSGVSPTLVISHSTFFSNTATARDGGAIRHIVGTIRIEDSTFSYNTAARHGGGLKIEGIGSSVSITNSLIFSNSTASNGGGIHNNALLTLSQVEILSNSVQTYDGGGLYNDSLGVAAVSQSTFGYNGARYGGAIYSLGQLSLSDSTVSHNTASQDAAGINTGSIFTATATTIAYNTADDDAGGLYNTGQATLLNSTVSHNQALGNTHNVGGGGIQQFQESVSPELHLIHTTIVSNTANSGGDGLYLIDGQATFTNSIIAHNGTENCGASTGSFVSGGYNLEDINTCALTATTDITDTVALLGPLADNGGETQTHALLEGSPALDVIPAASCVVNTDQRGINRPQGDNCDIGAVENSQAIIIYLPLVLK